MKNKRFLLKLKAGALQYTIFVAVVIALLVFAFISLSYTQRHFKLKADHFSEVVHRSNLAIDYAQNTVIPYNEITKIQISDNELENTTIQTAHWGVFDLVTATSSINKETFTKNTLLGGFNANRSSLYLQDDNQPLVLVGTTRIEGKVQLPKQGIKRGTIAGNAYSGSQLIYGSIGASNDELPVLKNKEYIKQLTRGTTLAGKSTTIELKENSSIVNSFNETAKTFSSNIPIDLRDIKLVGRIMIKSTIKIIVHESAILKDVILVAPKIEIDNNVAGNFQVFATDEIRVGTGCKLNYPSSLVVYDKEVNSEVPWNYRNETHSTIEIGSGSDVKGVVGFLSDSKRNNYKAQIVLQEGSTVTGEVYCNRNIELKGTIVGSVFTKGFIANQFGSIYQNHIYNGNILSSDFPVTYSGLLFEDNTKNIAKWLY